MTELGSTLAQPRPELTQPCAAPVDLRGYQGLNAGPTERLWSADRDALTACGQTKADLLEFYRDRDAGLAGTPSQGDRR